MLIGSSWVSGGSLCVIGAQLGISEGHWVPVGLNRGQWGSVRFSKVNWRLVGLSGAYWQSVGVSGTQCSTRIHLSDILRYIFSRQTLREKCPNAEFFLV